MADDNDDVIEAEIDVSRIEKNAIKTFSEALIAQAEQCDWEEHELARLVLLIAKERNLSDKKTLKFLAECNICKPIVLARLNDAGLTFTASSIIHAMHEHAGHVDRFIETIGEGFEQGVLSTKDDSCIQALHEIGTDSMNTNQYHRFTRKICDFTEKKKVCGRVLHELSSHMQTAEAASFICDIISFDFFLDLTGTMKGFLAAMPDNSLADRVQSLVAETRCTDGDGNIIDSDEDEKGNLRGFVDDDMSDTDSHPYSRGRHKQDNDDDDDDGNGVFDEECDETRDGENDDDDDEEEDEDDDDDESGGSDGEGGGDACSDDEEEFLDDEEEDDDDERARVANRHKRKAAKSDPTRDRASGGNHSSSSGSGSNGRSKVLGKSKLRKGGVATGDDDDEIDWDDDEDVVVGAGAAVRMGTSVSNGGARASSSRHHESDGDSNGDGDIVWDAEGGGSPKFQPRHAPGKAGKSSSSSSTAVVTGRLSKKRRIQDDDDDDDDDG